MTNLSQQEPGRVSRRRLIAVAAPLVAGWSWPGDAAAEEPAVPPTTPAEALAQLYAGNRRFVAGSRGANHAIGAASGKWPPSKKPFAAFLGSDDSRVPIEIVEGKEAPSQISGLFHLTFARSATISTRRSARVSATRLRCSPNHRRCWLDSFASDGSSLRAGSMIWPAVSFRQLT